MVEEAITHPIAQNKINTVNKTYKPQVPKSKKDKSIRNKSEKDTSLDKSRSLDKPSASQRTETYYTVKTKNKSRSSSSVSFSDKSTKIEKHRERYVIKDNPSLSGMSVHGGSVKSESPDKQRIPH